MNKKNLNQRSLKSQHHLKKKEMINLLLLSEPLAQRIFLTVIPTACLRILVSRVYYFIFEQTHFSRLPNKDYIK